MIKKSFIIILISFFFNSCGFTPTHKVSDAAYKNSSVIYRVDVNNSYESRQILAKNLINAEKVDAKYYVDIKVIETETAINIQSSGSVSKYRVETLINFEIHEINSDQLIYKSRSRGSSNYDVSSSEYTNKLLKENALTTSLSEAIQLMNVIINSKVNE